MALLSGPLSQRYPQTNNSLLNNPLLNRFLPQVGQGPALYEEGSPLDVGVRGAGRVAGAVGGGLSTALGVLNPAAWYRAGRGLGNYLSQAPQRSLGDTARGMGMIEGEVPGAVEEKNTDNPAVMGARNSPSPVDGGSSPLFTKLEEDAMRERSAAAHYRPPTRAIRLPGGKFVFTNRDELGGEQVDVGDAGRAIRGADATPENIRMSEAPRIDPTSATMSALVRSSIRSSRGERAPGLATTPQPIRGRTVPGETPDISHGAVSMIEGTPQQQLDIKLNDALGALSLAGVNQERQVAEMDPADAALLGNPSVQSGSWALNAVMPRIDAANQRAEQETAQARAQIQDPKQLQQALREIEDRRSRTFIESLSIMSGLLGLRPQTIQ